MAYRLQDRSLGRWLGVIGSLAVAAGGCAGIKTMSASGSGTGSGGSSANGGSSGNPGQGGSSSGSGGTSSPSGSGGSGTGMDGGCYQATETFLPTTPTVFVLVDRSGSEFMNSTTGNYFTLRAATLQVIQMLQSQIRFGLGVFHGDHGTGACVPDFETVPIGMNNYDQIAAKYNSLGMPTTGKIDTPCFAVMPMVKKALTDDAAVSDGPKYMLFVTDGETDFCDDGEAVCPTDAVTWAIQDMYAATPPIGTLVIGLPSSMNTITATALQNFANAGAGQLPTIPQPNSGQVFTGMNLYNDCFNGEPPWKTAWMGLGKAALTPMATYGTPTMNAQVFTPSAVSQQALADQISAALQTVKSCTFDLAAEKIKVDLTQLGKAGVTIQGQSIPLSDTNGWHMLNDTQLELTGSACTTWKNPNTDTIHFDFPCDIIIPT
jgi:hypothetical protein